MKPLDQEKILHLQEGIFIPVKPNPVPLNFFCLVTHEGRLETQTLEVLVTSSIKRLLQEDEPLSTESKRSLP